MRDRPGPRSGSFVVTLAAALATLAMTLWLPRLRHPATPDSGARVVFAGDPSRGLPEGAHDGTRIPVAGSPSVGPRDALVTVVEFADFQCPFCARVVPTLAQLRQRYGDDVRIVWKHHPLPFHQHAMEAAEASAEAFAQGGDAMFWAMHDRLFDTQRALDRAVIDAAAQQSGLDMGRYAAAMERHTHAAEIARDVALAEALGANGTPEFFLNGSHLVGAQPLESFTSAVDRILARARTIEPRQRVYEAMVAAPVELEPPPSPSPSPRRAEPDPEQVLRVPVGSSPTTGPADALVTMVVFSDFQCPFCQRVELTLASLRARYPADLRIVWKNQPLPFHERARPAAEAAMEAYAQHGNAGFWAFHDAVFARPGALSEDADVERFAQEAQLDMPRFRAAMAAHAHAPEVDADMALATQLEANGTPHFFINGRRLVGAQPEATFVTAIDEARRRAEDFVRAHPQVGRAAYYEWIMAEAGTTVRRVATPEPRHDAEPDANAVHHVAPNPRAPSLGPANAPVVIEHFSDFQCPFCERVLPRLAEVRQRYGNRVRIVWRDYPLPFHDHAMMAAEAGREVLAQQGNTGFWRFHDALFAHQRELGREDLERYAAGQGVDLRRFRAALDAHTHERAVRADIAAADATGVQIGTPAFFINGRHLAGAQPFGEFQRRIDAALQAGPRRR